MERKLVPKDTWRGKIEEEPGEFAIEPRTRVGLSRYTWTLANSEPQ